MKREMNICRKEYVFDSLKKAEYAKKQISRKQKGASHDVYICPICGKYHIGPRYPKHKLNKILSKVKTNGINAKD